jgi:hypothetical protein
MQAGKPYKNKGSGLFLVLCCPYQSYVIRHVLMVFLMVHAQIPSRCTIMALSDTTLRTIKAGTKDTKIPDGRGLYLLVKVKGGKLWRTE